ncbi:MAG: hypothetical protein ACFCVA_02495 [Gammaproteobacteria bacterium]
MDILARLSAGVLMTKVRVILRLLRPWAIDHSLSSHAPEWWHWTASAPPAAVSRAKARSGTSSDLFATLRLEQLYRISDRLLQRKDAFRRLL